MIQVNQPINHLLISDPIAMSKTSDQKKRIPRTNADLALQNTPERIISATLKLLSTKCLHSITIRDIACEAKVNSALISYHFENKENLYKSIVASQFQAYLDLVISSFKTDGNVCENIRNACHAITAFHLSNPCWLTLYFRELSNPSAVYESVIKPCIQTASEQCVAMLKTGITSGAIKSDINPRHATLAMVGMINYFFMTKQIMSDLKLEPIDSIDEYTNFTCQMLLGTIANEFGNCEVQPKRKGGLQKN